MSFGENYNIFTDLNELERMVRSLKDYLKSNQLYGSIGGGFFTGGGAPNLTTGVIVMRLRRIEAQRATLDDRRRKAFDRARTQHDEIKTEMTDRYLARMEREANSRIDAMSQFFEECNEEPKLCPRIYKPEAFRRTVVAEVVTQLHADGVYSEDLDKKLRTTDKRLRRYVVDHDFLWDDALRDIYPKDGFWWLWSLPQT
ncbi:MAG: hypothetical protein AAF125_07420 [Chloroflexota bacterium]